MVPLIDVMLVLLLVFMITAPLLTHAIPVNLRARATNRRRRSLPGSRSRSTAAASSISMTDPLTALLSRRSSAKRRCARRSRC